MYICEMASGIYTITCTTNSKMYIGMSVNIKKRFEDHKSSLRNKTHRNQYLQRAWNKYGESNFRFEILEEWEEPYLLTMEHYWITLLNSRDPLYGYNIDPTSPFGRTRLSEETKRKIGDSNRGKIRSKEALENQSRAHLGYVFSEERKRVQSINGRKRYEKPFDMLTLDGSHIKSFNNIIEAVEYLGLKRVAKNNISANLKGIYKKTHGYIFKYKEV